MTLSHPLPDVRDGLSVVQRRVLLAMRDAGLAPGGAFKRSAAIAREVSERFRPRARDSAYDALVAMVQDFTLRYPLIEGEGNFGSIDGDSAAAPQYTEARLLPIAGELLAETDHAGGSTEPAVLGGAIPNLLVNGTAASPPNTVTNIPPHNLREVVSGAILLIDHPDATPGDLRALIPGPDFPTGALIFGQGGIKDYQETGQGRLTMRARAIIENDELVDRPRIVITEVPYGIAPFSLTNEIANEVRDKRIDGISDLRLEGTRDEVRISITLKRDASPERLLQQLYERTAMQTTLDVHMTALVPQPETGALVSTLVTLKELLEHFIAHRHAVIARRLQAESTRADLDSMETRKRLIKDDLLRIADAYGDDRRTEFRGEY